MSKAAMQLALEALETCDVVDYEQDFDHEKVDEAITALREALAEQPAQHEPVGDALYFTQWTADKKDLSDYVLVGSLSLAGIEDGEYGQSEINSFENTIEALQEKLVIGADHKKVPLLAYIGALNSTSPPAQRTWVGLTDAERYALADDVAQRGVPVFEAICEAEAKLKGRNQ